MNITEFLNNYNKSINYKELDNGFDLTIPFKFFNAESNLTLLIKKNNSGYYDINDKGNTLKYLNMLDVDLQNYKDKIEIICNLFSLKIQDGVVKGIVGYGTNQTYIQFHNYLQGLSHLSTIKYFD